VGNDLSVWTLVLDASPVVQAVLVLLMLASISSWAVIFRKRRVIARSRKTADQFEADFWSGGDLNELYKRVETKGREGTGLESIFESGFREFSRLRQQNLPSDELLEGSRRAMRVAQLREIDRLEHNLAMLATVGSTSPYVGLFGTVWGIMSAFHNLGNVQQATLAAVAPGIAEALIATAIGLFAAIPAVIAYNRFSDQVSRLELRFDTFMEEFSSILQRNSGARVTPAGQVR
jgi:biopolymer transport protein TolQ